MNEIKDVAYESLYYLMRDFIFEISYVLLCFIRTFLEVFTIAVDVRILISWFLNINPYYQPYVSLWEFTNPVMYWGRNIYPRIFGIEIAFMINLQILNYLGETARELLLKLEPFHQETIMKIFER
jgi:uncharacterized protein YggT (Ycf19 family)